MRRAMFSGLMVAALMAASVGGVRGAGPLDGRVPQDAIVYFGWSGAEALQGAYAGSNLKGVVDASTAREFIMQQVPKLIAEAAKNDPTAPEVIAKLQTGLGAAWRHPGAFYFCPVSFANPQRPEMRFGILCDAGAEAKVLGDLLKDALGKVPPSPELPVSVVQEGTMVSVSFGRAETGAERARGGGLAGAPGYVKAMGQFKLAAPAMVAYLDIAGALRVVNDGLSKVPGVPPEVRAKSGVVIDALGVGGMTQMALVSGFEGKEWKQEGFVGVNGPKKGLLTVMGSTPLSDGVLGVVPRDAVMFSTVKFDPQQLFTEARNVTEKIEPAALRELDGAVAMGGQMIGMDIERDILAPMGDEWVMYQAPLSDTGGNSMALVHKLRDGERFARTLTAAEAKINQAGAGQFKIEKMTASKIEFSAVSFLQYSAAWTVRNGYFYLSTVDGIAGAVKQVENRLPSVAENALYKGAMASMPAGIKATSISYSHPAKLYPEIRRTFLGILPLARAAGVEIPSGLLPDVSDVAGFMTPGATVTWWDAEGMHVAGHSAFPGAEFIGGTPGGPAAVGTVALGTAILLPSLGKARELSNRSVDAASERGLAVSCVIFAADNADRLPDDLARLVANGQVSAKQLVSKRSGTVPLVMDAETLRLSQSDFAAFSRLAAEHCDFVYLGKGMKNNTDAGVVLVYEKPGPHTIDGINLAFQDGHVEFVLWSRMEAAFVDTNAARRASNLPVVDVALMKREARVP